MTDWVDIINSTYLGPTELLRAHPASINPAEWMHERLVRSIAEFEKKLDDSQEIGARLVNFGNHRTIHIDNVGFWGNDLVIFYGTGADGKPMELYQHITQINVLFVAVPPSSDKPRRIGFALTRSLDEKQT
jgi:hypothetical protein